MNKNWWKESIIYQIYPRSFKDSNEDGIGDLRGVIDKLDYIQSLGVDIIWLCPVYDSPQDDNGYDIKDYYNIYKPFGTMADFDELLSKIHQKGMRLIMDLVVNHTSDEHAWFLESKSSLDNSKRDFYIWKNGSEEHPPNNWPSFFSGPAWEYDAHTKSHYLHLFSKKQPDLNWENEQVRDEIYQMMNWWLDKGVDGFRMDVISLISKRDYKDTPHKNFGETIANKYANGPKITTFLEEMVKNTIANYDAMTVGEGPGISFEESKKYVDPDGKRLNMLFHFDHMFIDHGSGGKFDPKPFDFLQFKKTFTKWDKIVQHGGWPAIFLGNHDFARVVSRWGNDQDYHEASAKAIALLLLTLRGTTYIYQGDEIGMTNVPFQEIGEYRDLETLNAYRELKAENGDAERFMDGVRAQGRDNARTPIQWTNEKNGGFSKTTPWIGANPNYDSINVADQKDNPDSILNFYRKAIQIRKSNSTLVYGEFELLQEDHPRLFAYRRQDRNGSFLVIINFSEDTQPLTLESDQSGEVILSNYSEAEIVKETGSLKPWQAVLLKVL